MRLARSKSRAGVSLTEVLVAIFVMSIGLMSLLTLFPLGALTMAQAIKDDRTAQAAANAAATAEAFNVRGDSTVISSGGNDAFSNPDGTDASKDAAVINAGAKLPPANPDGPSYPVFVDPLGVQLGTTRLGNTTTGTNNTTTPGMARQGVSFATGFQQQFRWFSLMDDMTYLSDDQGSPGLAANSSFPTVQREGRYTWTYLLRRPRAAVPSVTEMAVVVFAGRFLQSPLAENVYDQINFDNINSPNSVTVTWTANQSKPEIKRGSWIMDATLTTHDATSKNVVAEPHGYFYRVVGVTDGASSITLELQNNLKAGSTYDPVTKTYYGILVVLDNVVEVFEKGAGWKP